MDWGALQGFVAVAHEGSFTAAARRLFVTQSALTKQVQRLETQLGVRLLERSAAGVRVTVAGAVVLQACVHLSDTWGQLRLGLGSRGLPAPARDAGGEASAVRVGTFTRDTADLAQLLSTMMAPTAVQLTQHPPEALLPALVEGRLDAAFTHTPPGQPLPGPPGLHVRTLVHVPIWVLLSRSHPFAERESVTVAELNRAGTTWYVTPGAHTYTWDMSYLNADLSRPARTREMGWNGHADLEGSNGAALITASAVTDHSPQIAVPLLPEAAASYLLAWHPRLPETTAHRLLNALQAYHRYRAQRHTRYWRWIHQHPTSFPGIALQLA